MSESELRVKVLPRAAKKIDVLHPFQREFNETIANDQYEIICVEAPVGSGKSHIARTLIESNYDQKRMVVLTFPTKILMEAQIASIREDMKRSGTDLCVWPNPDETFREDAVNVVNYSTDAMLHLAKQDATRKYLEQSRGDLLTRLLDELGTSGGSAQAVVTTPDVLHLIAKNRYKSAKRVASYLSPHQIFVFDEFHLYYNLRNFPPLIETIVKDWKGRVVLLSATPVIHDEMKDIIRDYRCKSINFSPASIATKETPEKQKRVFNYELEVRIENFRTSKLDLWIDHLNKHLPTLETPMAIILDSVHRVQRLKELLVPILPTNQLKEWTGIRKDKFELAPETIVIGTSAIEVGLNLPFKSLIFEATYWPSAIQRLGRAGRFCDGKIVIFSSQRFFDSLKETSTWERSDFETDVLMKALRDPSDSLIGGEMFRGDSHAFVLIESRTREPIIYDQAIFSMYDIEDCEDLWMTLELDEKRRKLREWRVSNALIDEILLRDRIVPFVGALKGRLSDEYVRVEKCVESDDSITIFAGQAYVFDKPDVSGFTVDFDDLFEG